MEAETSLLFIDDMVNFGSTSFLIQHIQTHPVPGLKQTVLIRTDYVDTHETLTWDDVLLLGNSVPQQALHQAQRSVHCHDTVYLQFTSGTAGLPKAAMLSHFGIINNGRMCGARLDLNPDDIVCCPPPLFHAFGLVSGLICSLACGATIVFPSRDFDASAVVDALIRYGWMTETSAGSFMTAATDPAREKLETGNPGELCISGYLLQKGYYKNKEKTAEALVRDENGVIWIYTGDEASIDEEGYCRITGRIKDIIIRWENIYPTEIEERLMEHPDIEQAAIVGLKDDKYGEVVAAFLQSLPQHNRPSLNDVKDWIWQVLGRHKALVHVFWVGPGDSIGQYPVTGSGKIRKGVLREIGNNMIAGQENN
ncbi:hypothetical protein BDV24DRAFT_168475 [Aspergillus arachidicola]|uniref:AMP-binding enzyme n=1 Tax=Aspergillus arachidicola TaxID=656916 RepID=A0A5N6XSS8_9EURO|nr:hypothetical protein BDV24DRAFT_168475 [Aspergillus arachidicola]